jgi:hypothetical protein
MSSMSEMHMVITDAIRAQLAKPARAVVNSESAFVAQRLRDAGEHDAARLYWNYVCSSKKTQPFGQEVADLQAQLDALDSGLDSSWTRGT